MAARRLWGNPRRKGKLTGGQCAAIEKRREHRGSSRLPDQRRELGDERARNHLPYVTSDPVGLLAEQFDGDRTLMASRTRLCSLYPFRPVLVVSLRHEMLSARSRFMESRTR